MRQSNKISKITDNSREYKLARRFRETICGYCRPHRGCNKTSASWKNRSWKSYRKTQYKGIK